MATARIHAFNTQCHSIIKVMVSEPTVGLRIL